jgi:hypothetical protein
LYPWTTKDPAAATAAAAIAEPTLRGGRRRRVAATVFIKSPLESALQKLGQGIILEHQQHDYKTNHPFTPRRLAGAAEHQQQRHKLVVDRHTMDSMKTVVWHLTAAQQQETTDENISVVVMHLQSAIAEMNKAGRRRELETTSGTSATGTATFRESVIGLAKAAQDGDRQSFFLHRTTVQHGIQMAIGKLQAALEQISSSSEQEMQDFGRRLAETRKEYSNMARIDPHDLVATATVATNALESFLSETTSTDSTSSTQQQQQQLDLAKDLLGLIWILPVSIVTGTFFWAFAGIWEYRGELSLLQIWLLEILWVMDNIACAVGNGSVCLTDGLG